MLLKPSWSSFPGVEQLVQDVTVCSNILVRKAFTKNSAGEATWKQLHSDLRSISICEIKSQKTKGQRLCKSFNFLPLNTNKKKPQCTR